MSRDPDAPPPSHTMNLPMPRLDEHYDKAQIAKNKRDPRAVITTTPTARMMNEADLAFDVLKSAVGIAKGTDEGDGHPCFEELDAQLTKWIDTLNAGGELNIRELSAMRAMVRKQIGKMIPLNVRARMVRELMQYVYPKLGTQLVHLQHQISLDRQIKPLDKKETAIFEAQAKEVAKDLEEEF